MRIKPLNNYIVLEMENDYVMDNNPEISRIVKEGKVLLPEKNTLEKVAAWGRVAVAGNGCIYPFKKLDRVMIEHNLYNSFPYWYEEGGKMYRIVKESMLALVEE